MERFTSQLKQASFQTHGPMQTAWAANAKATLSRETVSNNQIPTMELINWADKDAAISLRLPVFYRFKQLSCIQE